MYLVFPIEKAHSWRQVDGSRLKLIDVSAGLNSFTGHLRKVSDLREVRLGAGDSSEWLVQDIQDVVNYRQEMDKFSDQSLYLNMVIFQILWLLLGGAGGSAISLILCETHVWAC